MTRTKYSYPNELLVYRRRMRFSQKQVARLLGHRDVSMISRYEQGRSLPPLLTALKLEILYRLPVAYLYSELYRGLKDQVRSGEEQLASPGRQLALF